MGKAICCLQKSGPVRVGAIGLGVGTHRRLRQAGRRCSASTKSTPRWCAWRSSISPTWPIAEESATSCWAMPGCRSNRSRRRNFDFFVLDAFTGDAIPTHLLTREAFAIYQQHLAPGGVIAFHVSNKYLRLAPVVRRLAEDCGMRASRIIDVGDWRRLAEPSCWILATRNERFLEGKSLQAAQLGRGRCPGAALDRPLQQSVSDSQESVADSTARGPTQSCWKVLHD